MMVHPTATNFSAVWLTLPSACQEIFVCVLWPSFEPFFGPAAILFLLFDNVLRNGHTSSISLTSHVYSTWPTTKI